MSVNPIVLWSSMVGICSIFTFWKQRHHIIFHPHKEITITPSELGIPFRDIHIRSNGGYIHGWYLTPQSHANKLIILSHGNAGNLSNRINFVEFWEEFLKPHGYALFLYDYPGFGLSTTPLDYPTVHSSKGSLKSVIRYFMNDDNEGQRFTERDIILYGESIGGAITAVVAGELPSLHFHKVILQSTFSTLNDMAEIFSSFLSYITWLLPEELDVVKACKKLRQRQVDIVIMHSITDEVIPFSLFLKLQPYATSTVMLSGGHNDTTLDHDVAAAILGSQASR